MSDVNGAPPGSNHKQVAWEVETLKVLLGPVALGERAILERRHLAALEIVASGAGALSVYGLPRHG